MQFWWILVQCVPACTQNNFAQVARESDPWDYWAGYMDRKSDFVGRPYTTQDMDHIGRGLKSWATNSQKTG